MHALRKLLSKKSQVKSVPSEQEDIVYSRAYLPEGSGTIYKDLRSQDNEIRLLTIERGEPLDWPLRCWLTVASLDAVPPPAYETISYCWGADPRRIPIIINGEMMEIHVSSALALRRLRFADVKRTIWIDRVCINQDKIKERNEQVALMGRIYRESQGNIVYLGEDTRGEAGRVARNVKSLTWTVALNMYHHFSYTLDMLVPDAASGALFWKCPREMTGSDLISMEDMNGLRELYSLPWFRRLWVLQEVALAPKKNIAYWGSSTFDVRDILMIPAVFYQTAAGLLTAPYNWHDTQIDSVAGSVAASMMFSLVQWDHETSILPKSRPFILLRALFNFKKHLLAKDSRDSVFALNELFRLIAGLDKLPKHLEPDYNKHEVEVFRNATRLMLELDGDWILSEIYHSKETDFAILDKPSWVVAWDRKFMARTPSRVGTISPLAGRPPGSQDLPSLRFGTPAACEQDVLTIQGYISGPVPWSTRCMRAEDIRDYETVDWLLKELRIHGMRNWDEHEALVAMACVLVGGSFLYGVDTYYDGDAAAAGLAAMILDMAIFRFLPYVAPNQSASRKFYNLFDLSAENRCFFSAPSGHLGCGPEAMRQGDFLAVFHGGELPYILRPAGGGLYYLVGAAYVYGLMNGEIFSMGIDQMQISIV